MMFVVINYWELGGGGLPNEKIAGPKLDVIPPPPTPPLLEGVKLVPLSPVFGPLPPN